MQHMEDSEKKESVIISIYNSKKYIEDLSFDKKLVAIQ